ncbi:MAG: hypothetical protein ACRECQ_12955 [Burkholderiaceae bacterium]
MKRGDLEKRHQTRTAVNAYGRAAPTLPDRREQRERDRALGLVPFAVKLPQELVKKLQQRAADGNVGINELTAELLSKSLAK